MSDDVIAAIITPPGEGAVGAVRASGPRCWDVVARVLRVSGGTLPPARDRRMTYGWVVDPKSGEILDEVLFVLMRGPHSYTGEDVVEIFGHGGMVTIRRILRAVLDAGCRPAEPGEFTRRAFLNGRMDLSQAEAVIDLIRARTDRAADAALGQLEGRLAREIEKVTLPLVHEIAALEAEMDFPEDEAVDPDRELLARKLESWVSDLGALVDGAGAGRLIREGILAVIAGPTNVGKSSLLNALADKERAIVTEVAGTTRDAIEEWIDVRGVAVRLVDTAGIRQTDDPVERIGVDLARRYLHQADVILFVLDAGDSPDLEPSAEIYSEIGSKPAIVVLNKADLPERITVERARELFPERPVVKLSLKDRTGLDLLEEALVNTVFGGAIPASDGLILTSERHRRAVLDAVGSLRAASRSLKDRIEIELVAADMRYALDALHRITGRDAAAEVLDAVFSRFCVGK